MNIQRHLRPLILCVDDQETEDESKLFKRVLESAGYRVLIATGAGEALEMFQKNYVDLVLTEHIGPTMLNGPTLPAIMKMLKPEVPVAIYSADWAASPEDTSVADRFITKLVPLDDLLGTIKSRLAGGAKRAA